MMVIKLRQTIVTLLVLLQFVAPLLHAHSGVELTQDSVHLPGLEVMDNHYSGADTLKSISQHEACGFAVGIGIPYLCEISGVDSPLIVDNNILSNCTQQSEKLIFYQLDDYFPKPPTQTNISRAPPFLTL